MITLKLHESKNCILDKIQKTFDDWAENGRSELMEKEHAKTVLKFIKTIKFKKNFSFLDIGCGNGWAIRKISSNDDCQKAVGIDKSKKMIENAKEKSISKKEKFIQTDIESWRTKEEYDYVFSIESLYYSDSVENALKKIYKLIKEGGEFFCGTDFYKENKSTTNWSKKMGVTMHLYSEIEWKKLFENAGFKTKTRHVKNSKGNRKWKRELGTLFIIGTK